MHRLGLALTFGLLALACGPRGGDSRPLTFSASALGAEAEIVREQLARFARVHPALPGGRVELRVTPDAADQRHQLYVQWLNARADDPDVLQLDIIWTAEFAAAGWIVPVDATTASAVARDFFPATVAANRWRGQLFAVPWFVDVGLLYWRTDLMDAAPDSLDEMNASAGHAMRENDVRFGLVWQGARYEGLMTVFLEYLAAFGGAILDSRGNVTVDRPEAVRALRFMRDSLTGGIVPASALTWQEEQVRFAFQNGQSAFMRNWPYAWSLVQDPERSQVAGRVGVATLPAAAAGGRPAAALGGAQLAVNAHSDRIELAWELVAFLSAAEQMLERAQRVGQLPPRRSLYDDEVLAAALPLPVADVRGALESAVPRPATPVYTELSEILQVHIHRALTGQQEPDAALAEASREIRALLRRTGLDGGRDGDAAR